MKAELDRELDSKRAELAQMEHSIADAEEKLVQARRATETEVTLREATLVDLDRRIGDRSTVLQDLEAKVDHNTRLHQDHLARMKA